MPKSKEIKECCVGMQKALNEGYLYRPLQLKKNGQLAVMPPAILGEKVAPRSRKRKPSFVLALCPWCGFKFKTADE